MFNRSTLRFCTVLHGWRTFVRTQRLFLKPVMVLGWTIWFAWFWFAWFVAQSTAALAQSEERVGAIEVSDVYLSPRFHYLESRSGRFELGETFVGFRWHRDQDVSANVLLGSRELSSPPRRYIDLDERKDPEVALVEAYIEAQSLVGKMRLGQIPLPFGIEGARGEARLQFPRSLLWRGRWLGLRDRGFAYSVEHKGYLNEWAIHNGEGGEERDNQLWLTARWSVRWSARGRDDFFAGLSGSTGRTTPASTDDLVLPRTQLNAGLIPSENARVRIGNVFFEWSKRTFGLVAEGTLGESVQASSRARFRGGHMDLHYYWSQRIGIHARFDALDPSNRFKNDREEETTLGLSLRGLYSNSVVYFLATQAHLEGHQTDRHEAMLIWRLTPVALSSR